MEILCSWIYHAYYTIQQITVSYKVLLVMSWVELQQKYMHQLWDCFSLCKHSIKGMLRLINWPQLHWFWRTSANFSAVAITAAACNDVSEVDFKHEHQRILTEWPETMEGNTDASQMRRPLTPSTLSSLSTTPSSSEADIRQVPIGW